MDVEKALLQGCGHVLARVRDGEDAETELNHYLEMLRFQGNESGVSDPSKTRRLRNATLTYYVVGQSPERNVSRLGVQRARLRTRFLEDTSVVPGEDVKRAFAVGINESRYRSQLRGIRGGEVGAGAGSTASC